MNLQMTMTLGDVVVAGTTVLAIVAAYYAVKNNLAALTVMVKSHEESIDEHDGRLTRHGERLSALDTKVFGRRQSDRQEE